jgi:hypothetical protein
MKSTGTALDLPIPAGACLTVSRFEPSRFTASRLAIACLAFSRLAFSRLAISCFAISIGACARSLAPFDEIDGNHDGRISQQEASRDTALAERFAKLDADGDGELTPFEYLQYLQASNRL